MINVNGLFVVKLLCKRNHSRRAVLGRRNSTVNNGIDMNGVRFRGNNIPHLGFSQMLRDY